MKEHSLRHWLLLVLLSFIWGASFILMKKGLISFTYTQVASIRLLSASLVLLPFSIKSLKKLNKKNFFSILIVAFIGNAIPAYLFCIAQTNINSSLSGMLNATTPVFTLVFGIILFNKKMVSKQIFGVFIGLVGACALILAQSGNVEISFSPFALFVVLATLMYGYNINHVAHNLKSLNGLEIASLAFLFIGPFAAIDLMISDYSLAKESTELGLHLFYIIILGVLGSALAVVFINVLIQKAGGMFASSVTYLIPIFAIFWGIIDSEKISILQILAILLILVGVYFINKIKS